MQSAYQKLENKIAEIKALEHLMGLSSWDEATYMRAKSAPDRAEVVAHTAALRQQLLLDNAFGDLIEESSDESLTAMQQANLRVARESRLHAQAIPEALLKESKRAFSESHIAWATNRPNNDWKSTLPSLEASMRVAIEMSQHLAEAFQLEPYDALLNQYEPGITQALIDPVFDEVESFLVRHVGDVEKAQVEPIPLDGNYSVDEQVKLARVMMEELGFDFTRGRLDQSAHPFSCGSANDARITTRVGEDDFTQSLFAVFHETGHARYTQNQPDEWVMQFAGDATGMAVHESQSLFMEMQICRSDAFLEYLLPKLRTLLGASATDPSWSLENLKKVVRYVKRDLIRVYADEMSYPFHIVLRYNIEKQLCNRELEVRDLPDAWDQQMKELLDLDTRGNFKDGCMQDIHWFEGLFGYFPCYLLGAIYAAALFSACERKMGSVADSVRSGEFSGISAWLAENIHSKGSLLEGPDLMESVTGGPLSAKPYLDHIERRYIH